MSAIEDPTPGHWETSEYMIGSIAVGIILPDSNGTVDPSTEDWTGEEIDQVLDRIQYALNWWSSQNPGANVSFVTEAHERVPTSYELITHSTIDPGFRRAYDEIMTHIGYTGTGQTIDYVNDLRDKFHTDWAFMIIVVDSSNDPDGCFENGKSAYTDPWSRSRVWMTYDNNGWGINRMSQVCAHEIGHIFWATEEYNGQTERRGYLYVSDVENSSCLMDDCSMRLSGKPHGMNGTWGQIGWRDTDDDGIQDIVDTFPRVYLDAIEILQGRIKCSGIAVVTPHPNRNSYSMNPEGARDVTINKIKQVEFRADFGNWMSATPTDSTLGDAIESFTFVTEQLSLGQHFIEVRATNQWGNSGYTNSTIEIQELLPTDLNQDGIVNIRDLFIAAKAFQTKPGDEHWDPRADVDGNDLINMVDLYEVAKDYGKTV